MAFFTSSWSIDLVAIFIVLATSFYFWVLKKQTYWQKRNLINPEPTFYIGNAKDLIFAEQGISEFFNKIYKFFTDKKVPHGGLYFFCQPTYVPVDLDIIKHILQTDFQHFVDRGVAFNEKVDPLSAHLFALEGARWKNLRNKLSPTFTSGKMKMMFQTLVDCSDQLTIEMDKTVGKDSLDIKDVLGRFTTDIIGSCAFGIDCNSLKDPDNEFRKHGKVFFERTICEKIRDFVTFVYPGIMKYLPIRLVRKDFSDFFLSVIRKTVDYREQNNIHRKDFMHLLIQLKNHGKLVEDHEEEQCLQADSKHDIKEAITFNELAAQAFVFFLAGFETSSTTGTFCLYQLAANPTIQQKLREEINRVLDKHNGKITYDAIMEMTYMDHVINETLRMYPPVPSLNRVCNKEYKVPGTDYTMEKGTKIMIPIYSIQHDEKYYPNPEVFDPDRFQEDNKRDRHPCTFLPFGDGPRICIGLRFGVMQTKVGLTVLLKNYKFSVSPKTQVPIKMDPKSFILSTQGGVWLDYSKV